MTRIYWDSMIFIYLIEGNPNFGERVRHFYEGMVRRGDALCTSTFTVGEVLTGPRKRNDMIALRGLTEFFTSGEIEILPFDLEAANRYSIIRATMRCTQADGIHLAAAASAGVDIFLTNDGNLRKLSVPGIKFFADLEGKVT
ncbi:MAG: type II toxin-antitoxin system VapC family toxin [Terracidiphilus sp.]